MACEKDITKKRLNEQTVAFISKKKVEVHRICDMVAKVCEK